VQLPAFLGGTLGGMTVWSVLYASLGGASRKLLDNGADIGSLLTGGCGRGPVGLESLPLSLSLSLSLSLFYVCVCMCVCMHVHCV